MGISQARSAEVPYKGYSGSIASSSETNTGCLMNVAFTGTDQKVGKLDKFRVYAARPES